MNSPLSPTPAAPRVWSVAGLLVATSDALSARFGALAVRGEVSGLTRAGSGHVYFTLKDAAGGPAALRCAMFRRAAALAAGVLQEGVQVELRGRLAIYEARGELQMVVESAQRVGAGNLYEEFLRLRARLAAEGWFDAARKRALPGFVRRVGVVTSLAGAALHDVVATLARRAPQVQVIVYPSLVQGADAPAALVAALATAGARAEVDVVLLCRGGGSLEDLWAFNDERVVRAIAACPLPVVSGVGHETDITLADLVADLRAATPTAAAETVGAEREALLQALSMIAGRLRRRVEQRLHNEAQRVDQLALRLLRPAQALARSQARLQAQRTRLEQALQGQLQRRTQAQATLAARFVRAGERARAQARQRLALQQGRLEALDPGRVLERGYAWLQSPAGRPLGSVSELHAGDAVTAVLHDGRAALQVLPAAPGVVPSP